MTDKLPECAPPPEYDAVKWHWVKHPKYGAFPALWDREYRWWWNGSASLKPRIAAELGWQWLGHIGNPPTKRIEE